MKDGRSTQDVTVNRGNELLRPECDRVITLPHLQSSEEAIAIIVRVLSLDEEMVKLEIDRVLDSFADRHRDLESTWWKHYEKVKYYIPEDVSLSDERKLLIGATFTKEYSVEAAALFNPSIVLHPDQDGVPEGSARFIMSLRATGEQHISSIEFRTGIIDENGNTNFDETGEYVETPEVTKNTTYNRHLFSLKLNNIGVTNETASELLSDLTSQFTYDDFKEKVDTLKSSGFFDLARRENDLERVLHLERTGYVQADYEVTFNENLDLSERVIFPSSEIESKGIEDARFVKFTDEGKQTYYATYTAYDGTNIQPQLIETEDFLTFKISSLTGDAAMNKGMGLFPRKINGKYAMLARVDGKNNSIMFSDDINNWEEAKKIQVPQQPWELMQIGNCGSPIETEKGWLMITHGVGPMREYSISAILLDLDDPSKVIGQLPMPLLTPTKEEREGYVPNVVYSCGSLEHNGTLIIPYAASDQIYNVATIAISELLDKFESCKHRGMLDRKRVEGNTELNLRE